MDRGWDLKANRKSQPHSRRPTDMVVGAPPHVCVVPTHPQGPNFLTSNQASLQISLNLATSHKYRVTMVALQFVKCIPDELIWKQGGELHEYRSRAQDYCKEPPKKNSTAGSYVSC